MFGSRSRWHPSLFRLRRGQLDLDVTALYVEGLTFDCLLGTVAPIFKGYKAKTSRSIRHLIDHNDSIDHRSEFFEYFLESVFVNVRWNPSNKNLVVELFWCQFLLLVLIVVMLRITVAAAVFVV